MISSNFVYICEKFARLNIVIRFEITLSLHKATLKLKGNDFLSLYPDSLEYIFILPSASMSEYLDAGTHKFKNYKFFET